MEGLVLAMTEKIREGNTQVSVSSISKPIDVRANGAQNHALQLMRQPTPLYTLRLIRPGQQRGTAYWSFVFVDGGMRFIGKLDGLEPNAPRGDLICDVLRSLPLNEAERLLKQKGVLKESAVDYLKARRLLE